MLKLKAKLLVGVLSVAAAVVAGCNELATTAPESNGPRLAEVLSTPQLVTVLERNQMLNKPLSVSENIGKNGGTIEIPELGFKLVIPQNALVPPSRSKSVRITVTAPAGKSVAYTFEPHGLEFRSSIRFEQSLRYTSAASGSHPLLQGAYFTGEVKSNTAEVSEFRPTDIDVLGGKIKFTIDHFSGYLVAAG